MILDSRPKTAASRELAGILGPATLVLAGRADLIAYSYDASGPQHLPDVVILPADTGAVAKAVKWAAARQMPVVARGAGTNLSGGTVPASGGLVIELSRLNRVQALDLPRRRVVAGPGMTNLALQEYLAPFGYGFAPDPASQKVSTLGGNVGENAGGPHCLKYGVTADHVLGMTAVLAGGEVVRLGYGDGPADGLAATGALVGSEGTLAVFTELVLRLEPLPAAVKTIWAVYDRLEDAGRTVSEIIGRRMLPATLELMDRITLQTVEESFHLGYPTDAEGALIIEVDGPAAGLARQVGEIERICRAMGARSVSAARDEAERARLWLGRRSAFGALARRSPIYSVQDATVPRNRLVEMMREVGEIAASHGLPVAIVAHAGDGNLHPIILYAEATPEKLAIVHTANQRILERAVSMGGTISGEHGVGLEKLDFLRLAVDEGALELMTRVKAAFDPAGQLNPGKAIVPANVPAPGDPGPIEKRVLTAREAARQLRATGSATRQAWLPARGPRVDALPGGPVSPPRLDATNLTVTADAGMAAPQLAMYLAEQGFWLPPLDHGWHGSVGGDMATAQPAPTDASLGALGRWLLGVRLVTGQGRTVRLGGQTMKNVAGYNLLPLLVGSYGRLGLMTELTLRLWPAPEEDLTLACRWSDLPSAVAGDSASLYAVTDPLIRATRPAALAAMSDPSGQAGGQEAQVLVRLAGLREDVEAASGSWRGALPFAALEKPAAQQAWRRWAAPLAAAAAAETPALTRFQVDPVGAASVIRGAPPGQTWSLCLISGSGFMAGEAGRWAETMSACRGGLSTWSPDRRWPAGIADARFVVAFDPDGIWDALGGEAR